jgi:hypothetical protein
LPPETLDPIPNANIEYTTVVGTVDNCTWGEFLNSGFLLDFSFFDFTSFNYTFTKLNETTATFVITSSTDSLRVEYALSKNGEYWKLGAHTDTGLPFNIVWGQITFFADNTGGLKTGNTDIILFTYSVNNNSLSFTFNNQTVNGTFSNNKTKLTINPSGEDIIFDKAL